MKMNDGWHDAGLDLTEKKDFCGYVCGPELDKIKSFVDNLRQVLKVNPELVKVMIGKARNEIYMLEEDIWREERKVINRTPPQS